ncbi:hypothetical protein QTN24_21445 [Cupriavidus sp. SZY C1]|uniref:hypothetical protein n=1 Tax=Cupriavidus sp. SZY C1 TaxID=3055037 RepID=UPI0028BB34D1|nr:hypothetical protein [Cupriavidus sp. SZY C1]MDT6964078.1 hypothetical protein [Cupriavidus sp. SZY C1]
MIKTMLGRLAAIRVQRRAAAPRQARGIERFEMQRMAPAQRRHLWLSFVCCVALLG